MEYKKEKRAGSWKQEVGSSEFEVQSLKYGECRLSARYPELVSGSQLVSTEVNSDRFRIRQLTDGMLSAAKSRIAGTEVEKENRSLSSQHIKNGSLNDTKIKLFSFTPPLESLSRKSGRSGEALYDNSICQRTGVNYTIYLS